MRRVGKNIRRHREGKRRWRAEPIAAAAKQPLKREKGMKKAISVLALSSIFIAGSAMASGYRIPEQSVDSTAKAGANVASAQRGDAAYFNPANMSCWSSMTGRFSAWSRARLSRTPAARPMKPVGLAARCHVC